MEIFIKVFGFQFFYQFLRGISTRATARRNLLLTGLSAGALALVWLMSSVTVISKLKDTPILEYGFTEWLIVVVYVVGASLGAIVQSRIDIKKGK